MCQQFKTQLTAVDLELWAPGAQRERASGRCCLLQSGRPAPGATMRQHFQNSADPRLVCVGA
eukprot:5388194-Alexandrium_andersonii.AAC.1